MRAVLDRCETVLRDERDGSHAGGDVRVRRGPRSARMVPAGVVRALRRPLRALVERGHPPRSGHRLRRRGVGRGAGRRSLEPGGGSPLRGPARRPVRRIPRGRRGPRRVVAGGDPAGGRVGAVRGPGGGAAARRRSRDRAGGGGVGRGDRGVRPACGGGGRPRRPATRGTRFRRSVPVGPWRRSRTGSRRAPPVHPRLPLVRGTTGRVVERAEVLDGAAWGSQAQHAPRFDAALSSLAGLGADIFVEIGPRAHLAPLIPRILGDRLPERAVVLSSQGAAAPDREPPADGGFLDAAAGLYEAGRELEFAGLFAGERRRKVALPAYPFQRRRYWVEPGAAPPPPVAPSPAGGAPAFGAG